VGLPLGIAFARAGAHVTLVDTDNERVAAVRGGRMPFRERGADQALPAALGTGRLAAVGSLAALPETEFVIVAIGTPVDEFLDPAVRAFDREIEHVVERMRDGQCLVLRSTVFPGVTDRLARRVRERRLEVDIAYCPERIAQGFALEELHALPQIVAGATPRATERAEALFRRLDVRIIVLPPVE